MKLAFLGTSHAARHLSAAAMEKGFELSAPSDADLVFVSEDTPTDGDGRRNLDIIIDLIALARAQCANDAPVVLTSAVPPGFTRALGIDIWHQSETLRIKDAAERARNPEMLIVGYRDEHAPIPMAYWMYLCAFGCPILRMTLEEAEFAKVAINCTLAAQVDNTNRLARAAEKVGARWPVIADVLRHDSRIGPRAYLEPGDWRKSPHLLRDSVTLQIIG